ncbi:MAG: hypothetical protein ACRDJC_14940 [Thermomicrobiales bacterium]
MKVVAVPEAELPALSAKQLRDTPERVRYLTGANISVDGAASHAVV